MTVWHKHRFIFIKPKKVAGTSAELLLGKFCGEEDILFPVLPHEEPFESGANVTEQAAPA